MSFKLRKATQRKFNADMRFVNQVIENDDLWQGRFVVRQKKANWEVFEDGSGGLLFVVVDFYDKKTKKHTTHMYEKLAGGHFNFCVSKLLRDMNTFIVEDLDVWKNEDPYNEKQDWRNVPYEKEGEVIYPWRA